MHRTTIMLPEELKLKAKQRAQSYGISLGELIRHALEKYLTSEARDQEEEDPFFADRVTWDGPVPDDYSINHDKHLYEALEEEFAGYGSPDDDAPKPEER